MQFQVYEYCREFFKDPKPWGSVNVSFLRLGRIEAPDAETALAKVKKKYPHLGRRIAVEGVDNDGVPRPISRTERFADSLQDA